MMKASERVYSFLQKYEQCRLTAYLLAGEKNYTIGWGHSDSKVKKDDTITQAQADAIFLSDVANVENQLNLNLWSNNVEVTQGQFDALVEFTFNLGIGNLLGSTLWRYILQDKFDLVPDQFLRWINANKKPNKGLMERRQQDVTWWNE